MCIICLYIYLKMLFFTPLFRRFSHLLFCFTPFECIFLLCCLVSYIGLTDYVLSLLLQGYVANLSVTER